MSANPSETQQAIQQARDALRNGDHGAARRWAEQAARNAPNLEEPWLILASVASPRASTKYIERALQINPESPRARRAMRWALERLQGLPDDTGSSPEPASTKPPAAKVKTKRARRSVLFPVVLLTLGCLVVIFAAWTASSTPVLASILNVASPPTEQIHPPMWARVAIAKPTYAGSPVLVQALDNPPPPVATEEPPTQAPTSPPATEPPEEIAAPPTATATESLVTPGILSMEVLADTPTPLAPPTNAYVQASPQPQAQAPVGNGVRWIDINLSEQRLYAYEGEILQTSFLASTGTWATPTVTGTFQIWNKTRIQDMSGPGYYLPDVPYVMYFYKDYGIHGTYWHNNFGTPMSHGCVNLTIPDSEWLFNWAYVGMTVRVHY
jgi:lipoprotein-anchoring transpeptidase ErfK/SrfK